MAADLAGEVRVQNQAGAAVQTVDDRSPSTPVACLVAGETVIDRLVVVLVLLTDLNAVSFVQGILLFTYRALSLSRGRTTGTAFRTFEALIRNWVCIEVSTLPETLGSVQEKALRTCLTFFPGDSIAFGAEGVASAS